MLNRGKKCVRNKMQRIYEIALAGAVSSDERVKPVQPYVAVGDAPEVPDLYSPEERLR